MNRLPHSLGSILAVLLLIVTGPLTSRVEGAVNKAPTVIVLSSSSSEPYLQVVDGFRKQLRSQNREIKSSTYFLGLDGEKNRQLMAEIGSRRADIIFTLGSRATQEVQAAYPDQPLVATMVLDEQLLNKSKQTTGVSLQFPAKVHLKWLRRMLPAARQVYLLYDPAENAARIKEIEKAADQVGLDIRGLAVESALQLPAALKSLGRQAGVLLGLADQTVYSGKTAQAVLLSTFRDRIAFVGLSRSWVKAGALYALERNYPDLGRQCGEMACRILAGTKVADIAPSTPETVLYVINMRTARHLRLTMNPRLVEGAAEVFE